MRWVAAPVLLVLLNPLLRNTELNDFGLLDTVEDDLEFRGNSWWLIVWTFIATYSVGDVINHHQIPLLLRLWFGFYSSDTKDVDHPSYHWFLTTPCRCPV